MGRDGISSPPPAAIHSQSPPCPGWSCSQGGGTRPGWFMLTAPSPAPARSQRLDFNHGENKPKRDPPPGSRLCRPRPAAALLLFPSLFRAQALAAPLLQTKGSWPPRTKAPPSPRASPLGALSRQHKEAVHRTPLVMVLKMHRIPPGVLVAQGLAAPLSPPHPGFPLPSPLLVWRWPPSQAG